MLGSRIGWAKLVSALATEPAAAGFVATALLSTLGGVAPSMLPARALAQEAEFCSAPPFMGPPLLWDEAPSCEAIDAAPRRSAILACLPHSAGTRAVTPASSTADARRAREAWQRVHALADEGRLSEALVELESVRVALPRLSDRVDAIEAELRDRLGVSRAACDAWARASESPLSSIALRARVARTRCELGLGERRAVSALAELDARYPELPDRDALHLALGLALEGWGDRDAAIREYRVIDLEHPWTEEAAASRSRLAALAAEGARVRPLTLMQRVERADRLTRSGPPSLAREEIERLRAEDMPRAHAARVALMAARLARVEGRFEDAAALMREARGLDPLVGDDPAAVREQSDDLASAARARAVEAAQAELRAMGVRRPLRATTTTRLFMMLRIAARVGLREELDVVLTELVSRDSLPCGLRVDAAILAGGTGDDALVETLLARCVAAPGRGLAARYHHARALERLERLGDARAELEVVIAEDDSDLGWYALLARTRLAALPAEAPRVVADPATEPEAAIDESSTTDPSDEPAVLTLPVSDEGKTGETAAAVRELADEGEAGTSEEPVDEPAEDPSEEALDELADVETVDAPPPLEDAAIERALSSLAERHATGFPWFGRALDLVRLGERQAATDELHQAYLAWSESRGRAPLRADVEAVYRGDTPPRMRSSVEAWRARRELGSDDREELADVSASLGDHGLAIRWGGPARAAHRPRPYEPIVRAAAERYGIDPNLVFAVMRVESVYNPRIVSYAGAIGLLQIMPRTGRLIAHSMGLSDWTTDRLLDPATNIEMAAWYLASLLRRFDGRLPLAIAAYNGGPHNVRRWMRDHSASMPIDAFVERIPFDQTHRYVRRVLTHYEAYRAQEGLGPPALDLTLPDLDADRVAF